MKFFQMIGIFSLVALNACSPKMEKISLHDSIMAFGDSLTYGYGATAEQSYPAQLHNITGYHIINAGLNGDTTEAGKQRLKEAVAENHPGVVILSLGGNDMLRKYPQAQTIQNLKEMIEYLKSQNIQVVLLAEPQPTIWATSFGLDDARFYKEIGKDEHVLVLKGIYSKYLSKEELKSDLIHLNAKGYRLVAEDIAKELKSADLID